MDRLHVLKIQLDLILKMVVLILLFVRKVIIVRVVQAQKYHALQALQLKTKAQLSVWHVHQDCIQTAMVVWSVKNVTQIITLNLIITLVVKNVQTEKEHSPVNSEQLRAKVVVPVNMVNHALHVLLECFDQPVIAMLLFAKIAPLGIIKMLNMVQPVYLVFLDVIKQQWVKDCVESVHSIITLQNLIQHSAINALLAKQPTAESVLVLAKLVRLVSTGNFVMTVLLECIEKVVMILMLRYVQNVQSGGIKKTKAVPPV
jgi:hypothetical protein